MERKLKEIPEYVRSVMDYLDIAGFDAYLVGGAVRDLALGRKPKDYDITTNALPEQVKSIFPHTVLTGEKHGTVTVVTDGGNVEVTTMRKDGIYKDNRRPETVQFTSNIEDDLARRDFTINAMAISKDGWTGQDGMVDLRKHIIKTVGDPNDRFNEDALRMLRAIRLACQLLFEIDDNTLESISKNKLLIKNISAERIRDELIKILISNYPGKGIELLRITGLLEIILPEVYVTVGFEQHNSFHYADVYNHTLLVVALVQNDLALRLAALLHDVGKPDTFSMDGEGIGHFYGHQSVSADMAKNILQRLRFDNKTIEDVTILVNEHMNKYGTNLKRQINRVGENNIYKLIDLIKADMEASTLFDIRQVTKMKADVDKILNEKQPLTVKDLKINGYDLIAMGIQPGKHMGDILKELLELVLEKPELNTEDYLRRYVGNKYSR